MQHGSGDDELRIGIDWGGTKIEVIALDRGDGAELIRRRVDTPRGDYHGCLRAIRSLIDGLESELGRSGSVGIGIPGSIEPGSGLGKGCNSTWLLGQAIERDLAAALQRPFKVDNDANCLALSEAIDGAGAGFDVVFAVILGTGSGAGISVDGRVLRGPNNSAGEWAHNQLPRATPAELPGPACYCGRFGCLETWISGTGFADDYSRHNPGEPCNAEAVVARMRAGEVVASMVYRRYLDRLARGLSIVVNVLDPDVIVLGGGMSNIDELYVDLPAKLAEHVFSTVLNTPIKQCAHGDSSGVRGAALLWDQT